jgi:hypothetical protein
VGRLATARRPSTESSACCGRWAHSESASQPPLSRHRPRARHSDRCPYDRPDWCPSTEAAPARRLRLHVSRFAKAPAQTGSLARKHGAGRAHRSAVSPPSTGSLAATALRGPQHPDRTIPRSQKIVAQSSAGCGATQAGAQRAPTVLQGGNRPTRCVGRNQGLCLWRGGRGRSPRRTILPLTRAPRPRTPARPRGSLRRASSRTSA